jgi:carboxyl-terminal processing protease
MFSRSTPIVLAMLSLLTACGGGSGSDSSEVPSVFSNDWRSLANRCAVPRTGANPITGKAYTDQKGSVQDEKNFLASWTQETYLWNNEVQALRQVDTSAATPQAYFEQLKTFAITASGNKKDKFHFTQPTLEAQAKMAGGADVSFGIHLKAIRKDVPRELVIADITPGSPAANVQLALKRGARIIKVDGIDVVNETGSANLEKLKAAVAPSRVGETHQWVVRDVGSTTLRTVNLVAAEVIEPPVHNLRTLAGGSVGYLQFDAHVDTAEPALIDAITRLKAANVTDLVLDVRYNGGGEVLIASELAYMVAGPNLTTGKDFGSAEFNPAHPTTNAVTGEPNEATPFFNAAAGRTTSVPRGTRLPFLGLSKVFVLTSAGSCSATEALINGLRGAGVEVIQVGSTTCGKPYGFYPVDNCGTTYHSIQMHFLNGQGFGDYADGFTAQNGDVANKAKGAILPGCSVADDFNHALGDPAEAQLAAALQYRTSRSCPAASGLTSSELKQTASNHTGLSFEISKRPQGMYLDR